MDGLVAQEMDQVSEEDDFEAWVAYRKARRAKKNSSDGGSRDSVPMYGKEKIKNAVNYRAGETNKCFVRNSEFHYAPQRPRKSGKSAVPLPVNTGKEKPPRNRTPQLL